MWLCRQINDREDRKSQIYGSLMNKMKYDIVFIFHKHEENVYSLCWNKKF